MSTEPRYPYVSISVDESEAEEASAVLFELGALGVELRDATTMVRGASSNTGDGSSRVTLVASFAGDDDSRAAASTLPAGWGAEVGAVVGDAWRDEWKKHFEPFAICPTIIVRPPWRQYDGRPDEHVIVLEPGRAFGTGLHETTRLVAEILAENAALLRDVDILDVGCGSGILTLVAIALGARGARAVDVDPEAVAVTRENAERNALSDRVVVDDASVRAIGALYPVVVANIEAAPLIAMAADLADCVASGGRLVLSGILSPAVAPRQWESVRQAYGLFEVEAIRTKGEWIAAVLRR